MYSRVEKEQLNYISFNQRAISDQLADQRDNTDLDVIDIQLLASFIGSRKWASEKTVNSLALACIFGKPSLFITMTCNPDWPKIQEKLYPGQSVSDIPTIVSRVFKTKLKKLMNLLH
jgi:Helitron helicase-like domain at N-terminus